jgi:PAS domain S-box-containing protein
VAKLPKTQSDHRLTDNHCQAFFNHAELGISVANPEGTILFTNDSLCHMLGYLPGELEGHPWLELIHPEDRQNLRSSLQEILDGKCDNFKIKSKYQGKAGNLTWCQINVSATLNPDGLVDTLITIFEDISEQENTLQQLRDTLEKNEIILKGSLHRIKNNLHVISSMLSLQARSVSSAEALSAIQQSERRVRVMAQAHAHLYQSPSPLTLAVDKFLSAIIADINNSALMKSERFKLTTELADLHLTLDDAIIYGLIVNELLVYCLEYAAKVGRPGAIHVRLQSLDDGYAEIKIVDFGIGLPVGFNINQSKSFSLRLVKALLGRLDGKLTQKKHDGNSLTLTLKEN